MQESAGRQGVLFSISMPGAQAREQEKAPSGSADRSRKPEREFFLKFPKKIPKGRAWSSFRSFKVAERISVTLAATGKG
jgi:hypothetical protein